MLCSTKIYFDKTPANTTANKTVYTDVYYRKWSYSTFRKFESVNVRPTCQNLHVCLCTYKTLRRD